MTTAAGDTQSAAGTSSSSRTRDPLLIAIIVVATIGLLDAAYLTYIHYYGLGSLLCFGAHSGHSSCVTVQSSTWAKVDGIPVALLGLIGYVTLFASLLIPGDLGRGVGFGVSLIGFGFSMYLTYRELFSIHAICEWCVGSAICMTLLMILTGVRFVRAG